MIVVRRYAEVIQTVTAVVIRDLPVERLVETHRGSLPEERVANHNGGCSTVVVCHLSTVQKQQQNGSTAPIIFRIGY